MLLTIMTAAVQAIIDSIERDRPELLSAMTSSFKNELGPPWNKNEPAEPRISTFDGSEIHYAVAMQGVAAGITPQGISLSGKVDARFRRKRLKVLEDQKFGSPLTVVISFEDPQGVGSFHRLKFIDILLTGLTPPAVNQIVSWYVTAQTNDASEPNSGIPKEIKSAGVGVIKVSTPQFQVGRALFQGTLL